jgi:hypothetical protein
MSVSKIMKQAAFYEHANGIIRKAQAEKLVKLAEPKTQANLGAISNVLDDFNMTSGAEKIFAKFLGLPA